MNSTLEEALEDVRRAYWLISDYQQRMIELLAFINTVLEAKPYFREIRNRTPSNFTSLENSNNAGEKFLPMNDLSVLSLRNKGQEDYQHNHMPGDLLIDMFIINDSTRTSFYRQFKNFPKQESNSELAIYFFICDVPAPAPFNWYDKVWNRFRYPIPNEVGYCENAPGYLAYGEIISLAKLANEELIRKEIDELRKRASQALNSHTI